MESHLFECQPNQTDNLIGVIFYTHHTFDEDFAVAPPLSLFQPGPFCWGSCNSISISISMIMNGYKDLFPSSASASQWSELPSSQPPVEDIHGQREYHCWVLFSRHRVQRLHISLLNIKILLPMYLYLYLSLYLHLYLMRTCKYLSWRAADDSHNTYNDTDNLLLESPCLLVRPYNGHQSNMWACWSCRVLNWSTTVPNWFSGAPNWSRSIHKRKLLNKFPEKSQDADYLRGLRRVTHGLSALRAWSTKSSRPKGRI